MISTRRDFLRTASAAAVLAPAMLRGESDKLGKILPQREFGPKKEMITAFGLGGYHVWKAQDMKTCEAIVEKAMEKGVRFFDNAVNYFNGGSETFYGKALTPKYRDQIFLTTKSSQTTSEGVRKDFEGSLKRMKVDHVDLWQIHAITSVEDVKERIDNSVIDVFLEMREKKLARYIGFSGHTDPRAHCYFLDFCKEKGYKMDSCLMPINLADTHYDSFIINVLPKLQEQNISVFAMKTMAFGKFFDHTDEVEGGVITAKNLHEYAYSLPICCMLSGCETAEQVEQNTAILENFTGLDAGKRDQMVAAVEKISGKKLESYKGRI
jgi:uncharacterized protein